MRIAAIGLSWFRGASDLISLEPDCKSMVIYGANGSGKSSFIDAVEYVLTGGKVRHLAHEYSGKRLENAVPNVHMPEGRTAEVSIRFTEAETLKLEVQRDGTWTCSGGVAAAMDTWDYQRTVLRQHEVADFIQGTKGDKYSALLPLLGLHPLEVAAENLRQLAKSVDEESRLRETRGRLMEVMVKRTASFGTDSDAQVLFKIQELHAMYCADKAETTDPAQRCEELRTAIDIRISDSTGEQRRHIGLQDAASLDLKGRIAAVRDASTRLADAVEPLISEKLEVLKSTYALVEKLQDETEVKCPACGRLISAHAFQAHVSAERDRLSETLRTFDTRKAAIRTLCEIVKLLKSNLFKSDLLLWRDKLAEGALAENFTYLDEINIEALRTSCTVENLDELEEKLLPLINAATSASKDAPPDARQLSTDRQTVEAASAVIAANVQEAEADRAETLVALINVLEQGIREEIRLRSQKVIDAISADIQAMWAILHPREAITDVRLYIPKDADKAIDISLMFHGVQQESPRLTLSEGHRNSLGLCIFLAMAKREEGKDRPIFLDDVVLSLDRNHRGMIVELLEKEFSGRQVIVLTHDREWYTEMRQQCDGKNWLFKALLPYDTQPSASAGRTIRARSGTRAPISKIGRTQPETTRVRLWMSNSRSSLSVCKSECLTFAPTRTTGAQPMSSSSD